MARKTDQLRRQIQPLQHRPGLPLQAGFFKFLFERIAAVKPEVLLGKPVYQPGRDRQRLAYVTDRAARPVADDGGGNRGTVMAVFAIDVLDDFLAPLVFKVHVDVGRFAALAADKTLKQQFAFCRVDGRYTQAITDHRIGRRAAPLAKNLLLIGKPHDVMHGDEKHLVAKLFNQRQFKRKLHPDFPGNAARIAVLGPLPGQPPEPPCGRFRGRHHVVPRVAVQLANLVQVKAATRRHLQRGTQQRRRVNVGQPHARPQVRLGIGLQRKAAFMHGFTQLDGRHHVVQRLARAFVHQHISCRNQLHAGAFGHPLQLLQAQRVVQALQQFDGQPGIQAKKAFSPGRMRAKRFCIDSIGQGRQQDFAIRQR
ncbi:hypothetical protein D9M73_91340 [compost metagenome]